MPILVMAMAAYCGVCVFVVLGVGFVLGVGVAGVVVVFSVGSAWFLPNVPS